jgi:hypothetical protein
MGRSTAVLLVTLALLGGTAAEGRSVRKIDKRQGESARSLVLVGDSVRFYCKPCQDVVYSAVEVSSVLVEPFGDGFQLVLNGETVDLSEVYVEDVGSDHEWANLASLLGFVVEDRPQTLPHAVRDVELLRPHLGAYRGRVSGAEADLELRLDGRGLVGSYETASGVSRALRATAFNATSRGKSLVLMERDERDRGTALLQGGLEGATFAGTWTSLDGKQKESFELQQEEP